MVMIIISKVVARIQQLQEKQKYIKELSLECPLQCSVVDAKKCWCKKMLLTMWLLL